MVGSLAAYRIEVAAICVFFALETALIWRFGAWSADSGFWFAVEQAVCIALPFYIWNTTMAFVAIHQHTHPQVRWYDDEAEWSAFAGQVQGTVHLIWPRWLELVNHNLFEHGAHAVAKQVPLHQPSATRSASETACPGAVVDQQGSFSNLQRVLKTCRLYDYRNHRWTDWDGTGTALPGQHCGHASAGALFKGGD